MKKCLRKILLFVTFGVAVGFIYSFCSNPSVAPDRIKEAIGYCKLHNMNTHIILLCDFSNHSGMRRFYVYDTKKNKVILSSLCEQGKGKGFSNKPGSFCSSLGFYKVCYPHKMSNGISSFVLQGLSSSNNKAKDRGILIHPYYTICDLPTYPIPTLFNTSKGCFVLSPLKYILLKRILNKEMKPVLLYAFN